MTEAEWGSVQGLWSDRLLSDSGNSLLQLQGTASQPDLQTGAHDVCSQLASASGLASSDELSAMSAPALLSQLAQASCPDPHQPHLLLRLKLGTTTPEVSSLPQSTPPRSQQGMLYFATFPGNLQLCEGLALWHRMMQVVKDRLTSI